MKIKTLFLLGCTVLFASACSEEPTIGTQLEALEDPTSDDIINGVPAGDQAETIQGAMLFPSGQGLSVLCGSVYLGTNNQGQAWAATAAHCVDAIEPSDRFGFGGLDVASYNTNNTVSFSEAIQHPAWNPNTIKNDIAVVQLSSIPPNATPVTLANNNADASVGETVTISGYGFDEELGFLCLLFGFRCPSIPAELLEADTTVLSTFQCRQTFSDVDNTQICVADTVSDQGACNGDSGGPMFRDNGTVVGLTSFGVGGCDPDNPQVYTRVAAFREWIASETGI